MAAPPRFPGLTRSLNSSKSTIGRRRTPGLNNTSRTNQSLNQSIALSPVVTSVIEGRGLQRGQIGMAAIDMQSMDFFLYSFVDSSAYSNLKAQLQILDPSEVIVCDSLNEKNANAVLHEAVRSACDDVALSAVHRRYFDPIRGFDLYKSLRAGDCSTAIETMEKDWELSFSAFGALVKYVEHIDGVIFALASVRISLQASHRFCIMDTETWKTLRVICETRKSKDKRSLFTLLNHTLTSMGTRLLRQNLMQPLANKQEINLRLDAVEELISKPHLLEKVRGLLSRVHSVDSVLSVVVKTFLEKTVKNAEHRILQLIHLQQTLQIVEPLRILLLGIQCPMISLKAEALGDGRLASISSLLGETLDDDVLRVKGKRNSMAAKNQKCFAVREGLSAPLDVARRAYEQLLSDLQNEISELEEFLPEQPVRLAYSAARLFHYVWVTPQANHVQLPHPFINVVRNKASITFSSRLLMKFNDRIDQSVCEVLLASDEVISHVLISIRPMVSALYGLVDTIALLDFLASIVVYANERDSVRPSFGDSIVIRQGRFPLLDILGHKVVPNDAYMTPTSSFSLITGQNMAGKSTYTREIGSICLLAQIGCFVPAEAASLPIFKRICSRVGHNDTFAENLSSFAMEMREMATILSHADSNTLVLIDELARSTSVEEGIGISYAIIQELIRLQCFVVFTSHFLDLATLDACYSAVENFHFAPQVRMTAEGEVLDPSHSLYRGAYSGPLYGLEVAELSALPAPMMERARTLAESLHEQWSERRRKEENERRNILLRSAHAFRNLLRLEPGPATRAALLQLRDQLLDQLESSCS